MSNQRNWLKNIRGGLTHQEFADKAHIDRSYYTQIENGTRTPSVETAKKIAKAFSFKWTLFFDENSGERQLGDKPTGTG